ncbi:MAG TPA: hypothetical protein PLO62_05895 [Candidatus Hydrogenedentes bacterium]|nr:hypothetical protein [Candidatus Hydrogenedentota bacterium]
MPRKGTALAGLIFAGIAPVVVEGSYDARREKGSGTLERIEKAMQ